MRAVLVLLAAGGAVLATACTHDFAQYEPVDGSTSDGGGTKDGSGDGACTAPQGCFDTATSCGGQCKNQRDTCVNGCGGSQSCRQGCYNTEKTCRATCASTCTTCSSNAGCRAETQCTTASNN